MRSIYFAKISTSPFFRHVVFTIIYCTVAFEPLSRVSANERVQLREIQSLINELGLEYQQKPVVLSELTPENIRKVLLGDLSRHGIDGTYLLQFSDELSIFFSGGRRGDKELRRQTYRKGRWETWSGGPMYDRENRIHFMIDVHLQPYYFSGRHSKPVGEREPFYINGFPHNVDPEQVLAEYLSDRPTSRPAVQQVQTLTADLAKTDVDYERARSEYMDLKHLISTLGTLGGRQSISSIVKRYASSLNQLETTLSTLSKTRESTRQSRERAALAIDDEGIRRLLLSDSREEAIATYVTSHLQNRSASATPNSAYALHLRMEAAGHVQSRQQRTGLIDGILLDARRLFDISCAESAQTGILIWKALAQKPDWPDERIHAELEAAIEFILHSIAVYESNSIEIERTGNLHEVIRDMLRLRAEKATGIVRRDRYSWDMKRANFHRDRSVELKTTRQVKSTIDR